MRDILKRIVAHISRGWDKEPGYTHPQAKFMPPFFYELIYYIIALVILYKLGDYLLSFI
jgi:hypothetical protein